MNLIEVLETLVSKNNDFFVTPVSDYVRMKLSVRMNKGSIMFPNYFYDITNSLKFTKS